jgi:hypothetical protein
VQTSITRTGKPHEGSSTVCKGGDAPQTGGEDEEDEEDEEDDEVAPPNTLSCV